MRALNTRFLKLCLILIDKRISMFRTIMVCCCVLFAGLMLAPDTAEAKKRLGSGGSIGKSFFTPKKTSPSSTQDAAPKSAQTTSTSSQTTTAGKTNPPMGGMLGGLLAGGLLAALFFGGAFEGIQIMDLLVIAVIAFVLFKLLAGSRSGVQRREPSYAGYSQHPGGGNSANPAGDQVSPEPQTAGGFSWGHTANQAKVELPVWFDERAFLEGAKGHFAQLQQAWNSNDLALIRGYCSDELYQALELERQKLGAELLDNDLVSVMAELIGYREQHSEAQLSVLFNGWMREGSEAQVLEFREVWHLTRDLSVEGADWFLVGIDQV